MEGHRRAASSVAFSPDGKVLASAGGYFNDGRGAAHGEIKLWDGASGKKLHEVPGLTKSVVCVRYSPDGKYLASADWRQIVLWDAKAADGPRRLGEIAGDCRHLAFAPDSRRLAICTRQAIRLLDFPPRTVPKHLGGHTGSWPAGFTSVPFVVFSPDGKTVISAGDRVRIWNPDTGEELRTSAELLTRCSTAVLSPGGKTLITGSREGATLWDLCSMKPLRPLTTSTDYPLALALSPDGKTLAATIEHTSEGTNHLQDFVRLWDVATGKEKAPIGKGTHAPQLAFSPDGRRLAGVSMYSNPIIQIWDMKTGNVSLDIKSRTSWGPGQPLIGYSPDGRWLASVEMDATIRLWDAHSGKEVRVLRGHRERVRMLVFSLDGKRLLTGGDDDTLRLWDVATGQTLHELIGHQAAGTAAAFSPDGKRIASAAEDTTILIWDVPSLDKLVRSSPPPLTEEELQCLWTDLGAEEHSVRQRTIRRLMTAPKTTLAFLQPRFRPKLPHDDRLARLLDELDSDTFRVRENASRELARMGRSIEPALRWKLGERLSPEKRRRLRALVDALPLPPHPPRPFRGIAAEERRLLNVVVLLDRIGTPEALDLLHHLAHDPELSVLLADPSARWETREVKDVLARRTNLVSENK